MRISLTIIAMREVVVQGRGIIYLVMNMKNKENTFSFTVETTENVREKLIEELMANDGVETIYIEKVNGDLFPVANIERHPDCPKHIYEAWKRSLLQ